MNITAVADQLSLFTLAKEQIQSKSWVVTTLAGSTRGYADGTGTETQLDQPSGVAMDSSGILYVTDSSNHLIRKVTPEGEVNTLAGNTYGGYEDATGEEALFNYPFGVAVDLFGNVYVADMWNNRIRKITPKGVVSTFAGDGTKGHKNGFGTKAKFNSLGGIAVDSSGDLYVADHKNHRMRKITPEGEVSTFAGDGTKGHKDGTNEEAQFNYPYGVAVDLFSNVYVADKGNHRIRKITPEGEVSTLAGDGTKAEFNYPGDIAVDSFGNLYVTDTSNHRIRKITPEGEVSTLAGGGQKGYKDAVGTKAEFRYPSGVAMDSDGILYVADADNYRIRKIEYK